MGPCSSSHLETDKGNQDELLSVLSRKTSDASKINKLIDLFEYPPALDRDGHLTYPIDHSHRRLVDVLSTDILLCKRPVYPHTIGGHKWSFKHKYDSDCKGFAYDETLSISNLMATWILYEFLLNDRTDTHVIDGRQSILAIVDVRDKSFLSQIAWNGEIRIQFKTYVYIFKIEQPYQECIFSPITDHMKTERFQVRLRDVL